MQSRDNFRMMVRSAYMRGIYVQRISTGNKTADPPCLCLHKDAIPSKAFGRSLPSISYCFCSVVSAIISVFPGRSRVAAQMQLEMFKKLGLFPKHDVGIVLPLSDTAKHHVVACIST